MPQRILVALPDGSLSSVVAQQALHAALPNATLKVLKLKSLSTSRDAADDEPLDGETETADEETKTTTMATVAEALDQWQHERTTWDATRPADPIGFAGYMANLTVCVMDAAHVVHDADSRMLLSYALLTARAPCVIVTSNSAGNHLGSQSSSSSGGVGGSDRSSSQASSSQQSTRSAPGSPSKPADPLEGLPRLLREHALLSVITPSQISTFFAGFVAPQPGRVFVVEGGDGAGKQTQCAYLMRRLVAEGYPCATLDYPHDAAECGQVIRQVLAGHKGPLRAVNPMLFASMYGINRFDTGDRLHYWLMRGFNVVLDRYMSANFGHQASKYATEDERTAAIKSLETFETMWLGLPPASRVIYLNLPPEVAFAAMLGDSTRRELDLHEKAGIDYKNGVRKAFLWCCENLPGWKHVDCVVKQEERREAESISATPSTAAEDADAAAPSVAATTAATLAASCGRRLSREEVHEAIWNALSADFVNRQPQRRK